MPDLNNLASFGGGLAKTLFGGLLADRRREEDDKVQEQVRRLAAYHALLEHPETPESEVPNILDSMAKEVKADKEFAPITAHMREGMKRRVPTGPDSQMPVQPTRTRSMVGLPEDVASSVTVPGPTAEYGSLTQAQTEDARKMEIYRGQQDIQTDKMLEQQDAMTKRALAVAAQNDAARLARQEASYRSKRDLLPVAARLAADKERSGYEQALLAQLDHPPTETDRAWARGKAGDMMEIKFDSIIAQRNASAEASRATAENRRAQVKHWANQDSHAVRMETTAGLSAASLRVFNANTRELFPKLSRVESEIIRLSTMKSALGASNTTFDAQLQELKDQRSDLQLQIKDERDKLQAGVPTAPGSEGQSRGKYNVDLQKFGLLP